MLERKIVLAGTGSGAGKTTVTLGLMAAFARRGVAVQGFKCGPDYIDPTYHTAVTGKPSRNLDSWMLPKDTLKEIYVRAARSAELSIIEGVMGMFDGRDPTSNVGSTAEIAMLLEAPVILVVNCAGTARSAAAIVKGFQLLDPAVRVAGVIANRVSGERHAGLIRQAVEQECGIPVVGWLPKESGIEVPERHLGLVPSVERGELQPLFDKLGELAESHIDLDRLWQLAEGPRLQMPERVFANRSAAAGSPVTIAVARDSAFHFYYPENLELLIACGAELSFFSPLADEPVPESADGLYIGGGFPEEFAAALAGNHRSLQSVRHAIVSGLPTLAECGGYMYLTEAIETTEGSAYPMVGLIPGSVRMQRRLGSFGYREVWGEPGNFLLSAAEAAKGHEFHYSVYMPQPGADVAPAYRTKGRSGEAKEGFAAPNLCAGYTHLHFGSEPRIAERWVEACRLRKQALEAAKAEGNGM